MRYTEARMTQLAEELLKDIDKDTVDFTPNYDDSNGLNLMFYQVVVPNLLLNGSSGIAVGMATNIPPHSLDELVEALLALIEDPSIRCRRYHGVYQRTRFPNKRDYIW